MAHYKISSMDSQFSIFICWYLIEFMMPCMTGGGDQYSGDWDLVSLVGVDCCDCDCLILPLLYFFYTVH